MNSRDIIKIYASDEKEFVGTDYESLKAERDSYEMELRSQKESEECLFRQVVGKLESLNNAVASYERETGGHLYYTLENSKLKVNRFKSYGSLFKMFGM